MASQTAYLGSMMKIAYVNLEPDQAMQFQHKEILDHKLFITTSFHFTFYISVPKRVHTHAPILTRYIFQLSSMKGKQSILRLKFICFKC